MKRKNLTFIEEELYHLKSEQPLPVMVFIYGGSFRSGEARRESYGPDYFMHDDIVLVTFNYRVCALGFLSFADPALKIPAMLGSKIKYSP
ncbi:unnamed protein product [Ceratitis capitata]|uniref:carboxylesterase n=1 Tax=Ceratitis capitata TaxID=7213 RepID=A0A811UAY3_CERCA|nr:unnamed protein product [Ceratitis capitata]